MTVTSATGASSSDGGPRLGSAIFVQLGSSVTPLGGPLTSTATIAPSTGASGGNGQGGHRYVTVPGRGYNFVSPVSHQEPAQVPLPPTITAAGVHNLPLAVTRMIGRDEAAAALVSRLSRQRLVTIVGPGGIGKTTVALAVVERMIASYEHGVWLVDLAPSSTPRGRDLRSLIVARRVDHRRSLLSGSTSAGTVRNHCTPGEFQDC